MSGGVLVGSVLALLVLTAILTVLVREVVATTVVFAGYSLVLAVLWVLLAAPDVGLTEAAVGAGLLSVLLLVAIAKTHQPLGDRRSRSGLRIPSVVVVLAFVLGVSLTVPGLPPVGDPTAPAHTHLAPYYLASTPNEIGIANAVTAILTTYRGLDTLGEVVVLLTAGIGVLVVLGRSTVTGPSPERAHRIPVGRADPSELVRTGVRTVAPFVATLGLYVAFHGADSAGGGFQGGVIVGAAFVLLAVGTSIESVRESIGGLVFAVFTVGGIGIFLGLGLGAMILGGRFLEHGVYPGSSAPVYAIELLEIGIAATVFGVVLVFFFGLITGVDGGPEPPGREGPR